MKIMSCNFGMLVALSAMLLGTSTAAAQQITGSVTGTILDQSGAVVPQATVVLTNVGTGQSTTQQSNDAGRFVFNQVSPGDYQVKVNLGGFAPATTGTFAVAVGRTTSVDVTLQTGAVTESVTVTGSALALDVETTQVSSNFSSAIVAGMPNIGRNAFALAQLAAGLERFDNNASFNPGGSQLIGVGGNYTSGGGARRSQGNYYLDGIDNAGAWRNQALQFPNNDAVQEVQVTTSNASAEFGKQPGAFVNVITKSGTNDLHGAATYAFRNESLNANSWSRNASGVYASNALEVIAGLAEAGGPRNPRPPDKQKWFGGTVGGPIMRNKLFFFGSYQRFQDNSVETQFNANRFYPTQPMLRADFSAIPGLNLRDPDTGIPIPNNRIPASLLDPVSAKIVPFYESSLVSTYGETYTWTFENPVHNNEYLGKVDYNLSSAHTISATVMATRGQLTRPSVDGTNVVPAWGAFVSDGQQQSIAGRHAWILSPAVLLESRASFGRHRPLDDRTFKGSSLAELGSNFPAVSAGAQPYAARIDLPRLTAGHFNAEGRDIRNLRIIENMSVITGNHNIRFGGEIQRSSVYNWSPMDGARFNFNGKFSNARLNSSTGAVVPTPPTDVNDFAYAFADLLMGRANTFSAAGVRGTRVHDWRYFFFVQDTWRVTPRLTITPGLRYEYYGPVAESKGQLSTFWPGWSSSQFPIAKAGVMFQGDSGAVDGLFPLDRNNFAPRLGVSYDVTGKGKTVIRAASGYYFSFFPLATRFFYAQQNPWLVSRNGSNTLNMTDPWLTSRENVTDNRSRAFQYPSIPSFAVDPAAFDWGPRFNLNGIEPDLATPYYLQSNLTIAHQLAEGVTIDTGYVMMRGLKGALYQEGNLPTFAPSGTINDINARRPDQLYLSLRNLTTGMNMSRDAWQTNIHLRRGPVNGTFAYTFQKILSPLDNDAQDINIGTGVATGNARFLANERAQTGRNHILRASGVYDTPKLLGLPRGIRAFAGDWQLGSLFEWRGGDALNVTWGFDANFDGLGNDRPDQIGLIQTAKGNARLDNYFTLPANQIFGAPGVPSTANPYPFGSLGKNRIIGPSSWNMDAALTKIVRIAERFSAQIRFEAVNILNHNDLGNPSLNLNRFNSAGAPGNVNFGRITNRTHVPRTALVTLKFVF